MLSLRVEHTMLDTEAENQLVHLKNGGLFACDCRITPQEHLGHARFIR